MRKIIISAIASLIVCLLIVAVLWILSAIYDTYPNATFGLILFGIVFSFLYLTPWLR